MYKAFLLGILPLAIILAPANTRAQEILYPDFYQQVQELEMEGNFEKALEVLRANGNAFPEKYFTLLKEEIYIQEKLQKHEDNLALFKEGHQKGYFFFLHPSLPAFEPYRHLEGFDSLSAIDLKLRDEALTRSEMIYRVVSPQGHSRKATHPVLFIFHGGGSRMEKVMDHWHSPTLDKVFIRVYIQSCLHYDSESYGWRSGDERAIRDVTDIYEHVLADQPVDTSELYLAGISAGGTFAIDLALRQPFPIKGYITFCPGIPKILSTGVAATLLEKGSSVKGIFIGGEDDYYLPRQKQMAQIFDGLQLDYKHEVVPGMAHQYPVNESDWIEYALQYLRK